MSPFLQEALHVVRTVLAFIGGSAVLGFIGWLYKRRQENFEDKVLEMFANDPHQQLRTANGIHIDYRNQYLKDVTMWVLLPTHNDWRAGLKWRLPSFRPLQNKAHDYSSSSISLLRILRIS